MRAETMTERSESEPGRASGAPAVRRYEFPGTGAWSPLRRSPSGILSEASAGDMVYRPGTANPARERLFSAIGTPPGGVLAVELMHTRSVILYDGSRPFAGMAEEAARRGGADGIISVRDDVAVSVTVADCMPIFLYDRGSGAFGVLHSGWKGTGILAAALDLMTTRLGTRPRDVSVILGPAIGACCYTVDEARARAFAAEFGEESVRYPESYAAKPAGPSLDLAAANRAIAARIGVGALLDETACTSCSPELGSYRRQGPAGFTRMAALCGFFGFRSV